MASNISLIRLRGGIELFLCLLFIGGLFLLTSRGRHHSVILVADKSQNDPLVEEYCHDRRVSIEEIVQRHLSFDDPRIVQHIREKLLIPPSDKPYNINETLDSYTADRLEDFYEPIFGNKKGRIFIEAGVGTGELSSSTLLLEKSMHWTGVLIEADPTNVKSIQAKHRKAWLAPLCLSPLSMVIHTQFVQTVGANFLSHISFKKSQTNNVWLCPKQQDPSKSLAVLDIPESIAKENKCSRPVRKSLSMTCYPLYSLMLALNYTNVDLLSLSLVDLDLHVLSTLPFNNINIKVIIVEIEDMEQAEVIVAFLSLKGFNRLRKLGKYLLSEEIPHHVIFLHENHKMFLIP